MNKKIIGLSLVCISSLFSFDNINTASNLVFENKKMGMFNEKVTLELKKPIKVKLLLKILFPDYNIINFEKKNVLDKKIKLNLKNITKGEIINYLENKYNYYFEIDNFEKIIKLHKYKILRYYIPINGNISISTLVTLGSGGGTPPQPDISASYGGSGTADKEKEKGMNPMMMGMIGQGMGMGNQSMSKMGGEGNQGKQDNNKGGNGGGNGGGESKMGTDTGGSTIKITQTGISGLIKILKTLLNSDEKIYFDVKTGYLQLILRPRSEYKVKKLLSSILNEREKQIKITMKVIEFIKNKNTASGVSWNKLWDSVINGINITAAFNMIKVNKVNGTTEITNVDNQQFPLGINVQGTTSASNAFIGLLSQYGKVKILSEPSVILRNGETVIINNGETVNYVSKVKVTQGQDGNTIEYVPDKILNGFRLIINANAQNVNGRTKINLFLSPILQTIQKIRTVGNINDGSLVELPTISTRSVTLYTTMDNGETMVLGGFKKIYSGTTDSGVPIIKDLPFIGNLFKYKETERTEKRVLFIVTAKVLNNN